jgi:hypothetical protein
VTIRQRAQVPLGPKDPIQPSARRQGLSRAELRLAIAAQGGRCPICLGSVDESSAVVDHSHALARTHGHNPARGCRACLRGILCNRCNLMLGIVQDDPAVLDAAAAYVQRFRAAAV